jgi:8-oxo-dGTP diphosphatase
VVGADRVREDYGRDLGWQAVQRLPGRVAFDHREILDYAVRRLRSKLGYSSLGFELLAEEFTLPELRHVYEAILGVALNRGNFRRKVLEAGVVEDTGKTRPARGKPARLYRFRRRAFGLFETPDGFIEG